VALRGWVTVSLGAALVLGCGSDSSERSERRRTTTTTAPRTTATTSAAQTVPVPPTPPPPPTTGPPPAVPVPPAAPGTTTAPDTSPPETTRGSTTEPTVTVAPAPSPTTTRPARVTRRTVVYSPPDAPKRRGDLVVPRQHATTIVILVHPDENDGSRKLMRDWANFYAQHGYPSLAIDYSLTVPIGVTYPKPQTDVKAAVQYLRDRAEQLGIDAARIAVQGFGPGAALGAQAEVTPDDPFFDGPRRSPNVSDQPAAFIGFYGRYDGGGQNEPRFYYGGPPDSTDPEVQARYAKANSIAQAAKAAGPALLMQGEADDPDIVASAMAFRDALQAAGKVVTLTLVPGATSAFDQDASGELTPAGQQAAQQVLEWLAARFPPG
jgi:acetyl esterase/lipase